MTNGRAEALVSLEEIRQHNRDYLTKNDHFIGGKMVKGGFTVIPYNEIFLRVGGTSITLKEELEKDHDNNSEHGKIRSFDKGCGMFVALFIRSIAIRDIMSLFRTRARIGHVLGNEYVKKMRMLLRNRSWSFLQASIKYLFLPEPIANTLVPHRTP